jgi:hypothetical protein
LFGAPDLLQAVVTDVSRGEWFTHDVEFPITL